MTTQVSSPPTTHRMSMAKVGPAYARRHGLSANHHARVWCSCMDDPIHPPGSIPSGLYARPDRPREAVEQDPRRLWSYDYLGVVDLREPWSALRLFRSHVEEASRG